MTPASNEDRRVVAGFGDEWSRFDQSRLDAAEKRDMFESYFGVFPWEDLPADAQVADIGCGSGRWASLVAPRVGVLHCIDASPAALEVAKRNLRSEQNVVFHHSSVGDLPLEGAAFDFVYSLGVLHHVPNTLDGLRDCVRLLKPGGFLLVYLYYAFDNKPTWYRLLWRTSDLVRRSISRAPHGLRWSLSQLLAVAVYLPLSRTAARLERHGKDVSSFPLSFYRARSFYVMRTDALDRFGTRLERRFTRQELEHMLTQVGLVDVRFSDRAPYWVAVARRPLSAADD